MVKCARDYTTINSQPSIDPLKNLIKSIVSLYGSAEEIDDMFYYGVFCKPQNYANFKFESSEDYKFEVPSILIDGVTSEKSRMKYVNTLITKLMKENEKKPEWMKYVEMNIVCNEYGQAPSTFLHIIPKDEKYRDLSNRLIEFLYSPNLVITMI